MASTPQHQSILIELDNKTWNEQMDNVQSWLDNLLLTQASFRQLVGDTVDKVAEPHIKTYLGDIYKRAQRHEEKIEGLYSIINRNPSKIRQLLGTVAGKTRQVLGDLLALGGGATGPWQDIHQLYLANSNSMGSFAIAEQLGLALGLPQIVDITFPIIAEKSTDQLLLQELVLEMCSLSILYKKGF